MKKRALKSVLLIVLLTVFSCDEPETTVTNFVHPDGSVTRKIEMRNNENKFKLSDLQVPFDSTWVIKDTLELNEKKDTTWIRTAEKLFKNVDEINLAYKNDSGPNKEILRHAGFVKTFKWFNTEYRFSETIDKKLAFGYPARDFLNSEELLYFYSPQNVKHDKENGPDSLKYKALSDSVSNKTNTWGFKNLVSEWIGEFEKLIQGKAGNDMTAESLKAREDEFVKLLKINEPKFDSLWSNGILLKEFLGEANALKYKAEADSAISLATNNYFVNFKEYSVKIVMPGEVIGTNGFIAPEKVNTSVGSIDKPEVLLWPVKSDYFMTEPYIMWAESKITNTWAWVVSGIFLLFVLAGLVIRIIRK